MSRQKAGESAGLEIPYGVKRAFNSHALEFLRFFRDVNRDVFIASLMVYLALIILDRVKKGFASYFFNMNSLLAVVVVTGALAVISGDTSSQWGVGDKKGVPGPIMIAGTIMMGILGALLIYIATPASGKEALWSAAGGGVAMALLAALLMRNGHRKR